MKMITTGSAVAACLLCAGVFLAHGATVYWTEANFSAPRIVQANGNGVIVSTLALPAQSLPQALALGRATNRLYWTELAFLNAHVKFARTDFGDSGAVVSLQSCARGVAIDSTNGKIYWTTTNLQTGPGIFRANLDGSMAEQLESFGASSAHTPYGIAIDEKKRTVYWTDFGSGAIEKDSAAPLAPITPVVTGLAGPSGITLDPDSGYLFWTDANAGAIGRSKLDGSAVTNIVLGCSKPQYITIDRPSGRLYWTEFGANLVRSSKRDGTDTVVLAHTVFPPCGIAVSSEPPVATNNLHTPNAPGSYAVSVENPAGRVSGYVRVRYQLPQPGRVVIELFDLLARRVLPPVSVFQTAGYYQRDLNVGNLGPGAYCVRFHTGQFTSTSEQTIVR
jgi:DNA-binding beta-propeller fold protein YncE